MAWDEAAFTVLALIVTALSVWVLNEPDDGKPRCKNCNARLDVHGLDADRRDRLRCPKCGAVLARRT